MYCLSQATKWQKAKDDQFPSVLKGKGLKPLGSSLVQRQMRDILKYADWGNITFNFYFLKKKNLKIYAWIWTKCRALNSKKKKKKVIIIVSEEERFDSSWWRRSCHSVLLCIKDTSKHRYWYYACQKEKKNLSKLKFMQ